MSDVILGLDLSMRGLGLCALPVDWDLDWSRLTLERYGQELNKQADAASRIGRLASLAHKVCVFAEARHATHVWIEAYAYSRQSASTTVLAELGGVVRHELFRRLGLVAETAHLSTARKMLLGKLPKGKGLAKKMATASVRTLSGRPKLSEDECDAFVVANFGMSELGYFFVGANSDGQSSPSGY